MPPEQSDLEKEQAQVKRFEGWSWEISTRIFGTEEERRQNLKRLLQELEEERAEQNISQEEFVRRLKKATEFVSRMPLFHTTSLSSAVEIFTKGGIFSLSELKRKKEEGEQIENNTYQRDQMVGLDQFVFLTTQFRCVPVKGLVLRISNKVLDRPDVLVTAEDIAEIPDRIVFGRPFSTKNWARPGPISADLLAKTLEEYKRQVISGRDFRGFFSHLIATFHQEPEEYINVDFKREVGEHFACCREGNRRVPLSIKRWYEPEIKVMRGIEAEKIDFVLMDSEKEKDLLIQNGVPQAVVQTGLARGSEELYIRT